MVAIHLEVTSETNSLGRIAEMPDLNELNVLIVGRNRPNHLKRLLESDALDNPSLRFHIFLDGPEVNASRDLEEIMLRETQDLAREFIEQRSGKLKISQEKLGCYRGVTTAIDWFFENAKEGLILEDDLLLHPKSMDFVAKALETFREVDGVSSICLYRVGEREISGAFTFSSFTSSWGWATWKNRWELFDHNVERKISTHPLLMLKHGGIKGLKRWRSVSQRLRSGELDSWGYRWLFSVWLRRGMNLVFPYNLIENGGFDDFATHTKSGKSNRIETKEISVDALKWDSLQLRIDSYYDKKVLKNYFGI